MDSVSMELWDLNGRLGSVEGNVVVTFSLTSAAIAEVTVPLSHPLAAELLDTSGRMRLVVFHNERAFVGVIAAAVAAGAGSSAGMITATAVGGRSVLDQGIVIPGLTEVRHGEMLPTRVTGPVETVVKRLVEHSLGRLRFVPVVVAPDRGLGPHASVSADFQSCADAVSGALAGTGFVLDASGWVPGMTPVEGMTETRDLHTVIDVRPHQEREDLVWLADDLGPWKIRRARQGDSQLIIEAESGEDAIRVEVTSPFSTGWSEKESRVSAPDFLRPTDTLRERVSKLHEFGRGKLDNAREVQAVEVELQAANWPFATPAGFDLGDVGRVELPVVGWVQLVVTEVEISKTIAEGVKVKPTLATLSSTSSGLADIL